MVDINLNYFETRIIIESNEKELQKYLLNCLNNYYNQNNPIVNNKIKKINKITLEINNDEYDFLNEIINDIEQLNCNFLQIEADLINYKNQLINFTIFKTLKKINFLSYNNFIFNFYFPSELEEICLLECKNFNNKIINLPIGLKKLMLGKNFDNEFELPINLEELHLGTNFNQPLNNLPTGLKKLHFYFDAMFNQPLNKLPAGLKKLYFGFNSMFNQPLNNLPTGLKELYLGKYFNYSLDFLPESLELLSLFNVFELQINNLPTNLKKLYIYDNENHNFSLNNLPNSIEELEFSNYNIINKFPISLKKISINCHQVEKINLLNDLSIQELIISGYNNTTKLNYETFKFKIPSSLSYIETNHIDKKNNFIFDYIIENGFVEEDSEKEKRKFKKKIK